MEENPQTKKCSDMLNATKNSGKIEKHLHWIQKVNLMRTALQRDGNWIQFVNSWEVNEYEAAGMGMHVIKSRDYFLFVCFIFKKIKKQVEFRKKRVSGVTY